MDLKKKIGENKRGEEVRPPFHSFQTLFHKKNQLYFDVLGNLVFQLFSIVSKKVQNRKKGGGVKPQPEKTVGDQHLLLLKPSIGVKYEG